MRRKGFTLVELLVVIAIIALLMGILMPALARVRQLAFRMTCGTNLSGIGKAMLIYANDYEDELPRAGLQGATWGPLSNWAAADRRAAFQSNRATITSCFYLLVKYAEVTPKSFVCKGDAGTTEFKINEMNLNPTPELIQVWDFGPSGESWKHCSYSYHVPFGLYALTTASEPGFAVAAERNPWIQSPGADARVWQTTGTEAFLPDVPGTGYATGNSEQARNGNANAHQLDGQNVLFLDSHVDFAKRAYCSIEDDNIYTRSRNNPVGKGDLWGTGIPPLTADVAPANRKDSLLIHDTETGPGGGGTTPPGGRR
jgi:prepilin-type N-terminal cleavage/methylation domain-containing protein